MKYHSSEENTCQFHTRTWKLSSFYVCYTCLFVVLMAGLFLPFLLTGRSFVWVADARTQYYPQMVYLRRYLQELFSGLVHGDPGFRFYDLTIGMGEGIIVAARLHRLDALSALVPLDKVGVFYSLVIVLRLYLAGLAFSAFCHYKKLDRRAVMIGVIVYLSGDFATYRVTCHPFFAAALYMLPLMLLGTEKILQEGRGFCMILSSGLAFFVTYYYAYMCTIAVGVYFLLRWITVRRGIQGSRVKAFFGKGFYVIGCWLIGLGMTACIQIPIFTHLFTSDRLTTGDTGKLFLVYPAKYFINLILGFISPNIRAGYSTFLGFAGLVIPAVVVLFFEKISEYTTLRLAILIELAGLALPPVGLVMGAFGNVSNRWTFILSFTLALTCIHVIQEGPQFSARARNALLAATGLYAAGTFAFLVLGGRMQLSFLYRFNVAVGCICLVAAAGTMLVLRRKGASYVVYSRAILLIAFASAVLMSFVTFSPQFGNSVSAYMEWKELPSFYEDQPLSRMHASKEEGFQRVDTGFGHRLWLNSALYHDYYGVSQFNSVMNAGLQHFLLELENPGIDSTVKTLSLDGHAVCENLASVGYYMTGSENGIIPYGFEKVPDQEDSQSALYQNTMPLSFGYTYDTVLSLEEYEKLSAAQKQQVLMKTAVLEPEAISHLPEGSLEMTSPETAEICVPLHSADDPEGDSAEDTQQSFLLNPKQNELTFSCGKKEGCELYLHLIDVTYEDAHEEEDDQTLTVTGSAGVKKLYLRRSDSPYVLPTDGWMVYMGYSDSDAPEEITIRMNGKGRCKIGALEAVYIPMESYGTDVANRNAGGCDAPVISKNTIEGDLGEGEDRLVVVPVVYTNGWSLQVDGKETELVRANRCWTGFYVSKGAHHFVLTYAPVKFRLAIMISMIACGACLAVWVLEHRWKRAADRMTTDDRS